MNYLSHFYFNHHVAELPADPYFVMGVALPDLWKRYTRDRRIRWHHVRSFRALDHRDQSLQQGLLNHVAADRWFHALPVFAEWQRRLSSSMNHSDTDSVPAEFLVHLIVELVMDHLLVKGDPDLPRQFYEILGLCDPADMEQRMSKIAAVPTDGLATEIRGFIERRYLERFGCLAELVPVVHFVLKLAGVSDAPTEDGVFVLLNRAVEIVRPDALWDFHPPSDFSRPVPVDSISG